MSSVENRAAVRSRVCDYARRRTAINQATPTTTCIEPSAMAVPISDVARKALGAVSNAKISPIHAITLAALFHASPSNAVTPAATKMGTTDVPSTTNQGTAIPLACQLDPATLPIPKMTRLEMAAMTANRVTRLHEIVDVDVDN